MIHIRIPLYWIGYSRRRRRRRALYMCIHANAPTCVYIHCVNVYILGCNPCAMPTFMQKNQHCAANGLWHGFLHFVGEIFSLFLKTVNFYDFALVHLRYTRTILRTSVFVCFIVD